MKLFLLMSLLTVTIAPTSAYWGPLANPDSLLGKCFILGKEPCCETVFPDTFKTCPQNQTRCLSTGLFNILNPFPQLGEWSAKCCKLEGGNGYCYVENTNFTISVGCDGLSWSEGCDRPGISCCLSGCVDEGKKCEEQKGKCIKKTETCEGTTNDTLCSPDSLCTCCFPKCEDNNKQCATGHGSCIRKTQTCSGTTWDDGCVGDDCTCCVPGCEVDSRCSGKSYCYKEGNPGHSCAFTPTKDLCGALCVCCREGAVVQPPGGR